MTGSNRSSAELDSRRKRILFRCWHRGIREMDLILGQFADKELAGLDDSQLDELERIMIEEDNDLIKWITGEQQVPERHNTAMFGRIAATRPDFGLRLPVDTDDGK